MKPLILLAGPTAVGKTDLSIRLAKRIGGQIISADGGSNAGFFNPSFPQDVYENEE